MQKLLQEVSGMYGSVFYPIGEGATSTAYISLPPDLSAEQRREIMQRSLTTATTNVYLVSEYVEDLTKDLLQEVGGKHLPEIDALYEDEHVKIYGMPFYHVLDAGKKRVVFQETWEECNRIARELQKMERKARSERTYKGQMEKILEMAYYADNISNDIPLALEEIFNVLPSDGTDFFFEFQHENLAIDDTYQEIILLDVLKQVN